MWFKGYSGVWSWAVVFVVMTFLSRMASTFGLNRLSAEEQDVRVAKVVSRFDGELSPVKAKELLERYSWDVERTEREYGAFAAAGDGLLVPLTLMREDLPFQGAENNGNSCYLDSLLIAMFGTMDCFDDMIAEKRGELYTLLRYFVNRIRSGELVEKDTVDSILHALKVLGWHDNGSQEDASELFVFLMEVLDSPLLSASELLHHGALVDAESDHKQVRDRMVMLGVENSEKPVHLVDLLRRELQEGVVEDLRRHVDSGERRRMALVNALKTINFDPSSSKVFPILLKRRGEGPKADVIIPAQLDLSEFTTPEVEQRPRRLRSAICHLGSSTECGHYVTFLFSDDGECRRWDDLRGMTKSTATEKELATSAYLLFYE